MSIVSGSRSEYPAEAMAEPRHLHRAPIIEALIDLRVVMPEGLTIESLERSLQPLDFGYYVKSPISQGTIEFRAPPGGQPFESATQASVVGYRLHSDDERYVVQWQVGGITVSRLQPYQDWPTLLAECQRLWQIYAARCRPVRVSRVAARYINDLRLPLASGESYQLFLNRFVELPEGAPQAVEAFFQRFQLVDVSSGGRVALSLSQKGVREGEPAQVILDIDAFKERDMAADAAEIWSELEQLRVLKNRCFFSTITDRAAELYQ